MSAVEALPVLLAQPPSPSPTAIVSDLATPAPSLPASIMAFYLVVSPPFHPVTSNDHLNELLAGFADPTNTAVLGFALARGLGLPAAAVRIDTIAPLFTATTSVSGRELGTGRVSQGLSVALRYLQSAAALRGFRLACGVDAAAAAAAYRVPSLGDAMAALSAALSGGLANKTLFAALPPATAAALGYTGTEAFSAAVAVDPANPGIATNAAPPPRPPALDSVVGERAWAATVGFVGVGGLLAALWYARAQRRAEAAGKGGLGAPGGAAGPLSLRSVHVNAEGATPSTAPACFAHLPGPLKNYLKGMGAATGSGEVGKAPLAASAQVRAEIEGLNLGQDPDMVISQLREVGFCV